MEPASNLQEPFIKQAQHPDGTLISFYEDNHLYVREDTGEKLISVTTLLKNYFQEFDADYWAARCAPKRNTTPEALKIQWAEKGKRAANEGTNMHLYAEHLFRPKDIPCPEPISERCEVLFSQIADAVKWLGKHFKFHGTEHIVFSKKYNIAGTIDLTMTDRNVLLIMDWKQNEKIVKFNPYQSGKFPIEHLSDCNYTKYALQLNVYKRIIAEEEYYGSDFDDYRLMLLHITPEGYFPVPIDDMDDEVDAILKDFRSK